MEGLGSKGGHMDWNQVEGNWKQVRGNVKKQWGKLTDDDLTAIDGRREALEAESRSGTDTPKIVCERR